MKKVCLFSAIALLSTTIGAQDYQISFAIYGDSETVLDSVVVRNIEQGKIITLEGNDILHLVASISGITGIGTSNDKLEVFPNPFSNKATVLFQNDKQGQVKISLFDMAGKKVVQNTMSQPPGKTIVELRGLPVGAYVMQVETETSMFSEVILSNGASGNIPGIIFESSVKDDVVFLTTLKSSDKASEFVDMQYTAGDTLSLTAYLDDLSSEVKIAPDASTTISFEFQKNLEDFSTSDIITIAGGNLQVSDESGNIIKLTFPPGAVRDSTSVTLTLLGEQKDLPIDERQLRTFKIMPLDIKLYEPVSITIDYKLPVSEIEKAALFQLQSEGWLIPLSNHAYMNDSSSITAETLHFGEFAEGKMTLDQVNTQFDLLLSSLGISWNSTAKSTGQENQVFSDGSSHKETWDGWKKMAGGFVTFFNLKHQNGFYDSGENSLVKDQNTLCEKVLNKAVKEVLDKPLPDDLCDPDYTYTLASMVNDMNRLGCDGGTEFERLNERFDQTLINCSSYLTINMNLNVESGGLDMLTTGVVPIFTTTHMGNNATVEGTGDLVVFGSADAGGLCAGLISGKTAVDVAGNRDAAYTFTLTLNTYQTAVLTVVCPDGTTKTDLNGEDVLEISLGPANNFSYSKEEEVEGGGLFMVDIELSNPYISLPSED